MTRPSMPVHDRPLTPAQTRIWNTLADQVLNDGWTTLPDLLAHLIEAQAYGIDLEPVDVVTVLYALEGIGLVEVAGKKPRSHLWRVVDANRADDGPMPETITTDASRIALQAKTKTTGSPNPKDVPMFNRRKAAETKPVVLSAAAIEAERLRLQEQFHGPGYAARRALEGDPVLTERLDAAMADGLEVDLTDVPVFRRGAHVEAALVAWETARENGPCQFCGTATARRGQWTNRADALDDSQPPWTVWDGNTACQWCRDVLGERGDEGLRGLVFRAAASLRSASLSDRYYLAQWVPWWSELTPEKQAEHRKAGQPWGHIDRAAARALAADLLMRAGETGLAGFARTQGQVEHVSIPGLEARAWTTDDLPRPGGRVYADVGQAAARRTAQATNRAG